MILIECDNDYTFYRLLCPNCSQRQFRHFSKPELIKNVHAGEFGKVIGLCDEDDPRGHRIPFFDEFILDEDIPDVEMKLFRHRSSDDKHLIMVTPWLEKWLYRRAKLCKIDPSDYNLPRDPEVLHERFRVANNQNFKNFLQEIINRDKKLTKLRNWIETFS